MNICGVVRILVVVFSIDCIVSPPIRNDGVGIVQRCMKGMGVENKALGELTPVELAELKGMINKEHEHVLNLVVEELNNIKYPSKLGYEIEFYEDILAPTFLPREEDLKNYKGIARTIRSRKLKWKFILSLDHPSVKALKKYLNETEFDEFAKAMAVLYHDVKTFIRYALNFRFHDTIPKFIVSQKEKYAKYIPVLLRKVNHEEKHGKRG